MPFPRASGILLHPTSLPGRFGIGDLGIEAYRFVDFLANSGQQLWQVLPLGPAGHGNSPYMSYSAMAGNPMLISPEVLLESGLLTKADFADLPDFPLNKVDFEQVTSFKMQLFRQASHNFKAHASSLLQKEFRGFSDSQGYWLDDYAFFMTLKEYHGGASWHQWEPQFANRQPEAIALYRQKLSNEIFFHKFLQFEFFRQWSELKTYANMRGIKIIGDVPIYVAHDSVDVWAHPNNFILDQRTYEPALMAGVPPDLFSDTGQLWGNPVYDWKRIEKDNFQWWIQRIQTTLAYVDIIRLDHFRGFEAYWVIKKGEIDARKGKWLKAPGNKFLKVLRNKLGYLPIIAEDLGMITPEVEALRDDFSFPGMKILQFAFGPGRNDDYYPSNYPDENWVVYTGTHDNNTTVGWFYGFHPQTQRDIIAGIDDLGEEVTQIRKHGIHWAFIWLAMQSIANQAVFPLQDILGLGSEARMNVPSQAEGNWAWRYLPEAIKTETCDRLCKLTFRYNRTQDGHAAS